MNEIIKNYKLYNDFISEPTFGKEPDLIKLELVKNNLFESIIEYIKISYDINIINILYNELKQNFIKYITDYIDINPILSKLYSNYINYNVDKVETLNIKIIGPFYYKYYSFNNFRNLGNMNIYLYGEYHDININNCIIKESEFNINFDEYIDIILQNSSSFIDLYIENYFDEYYNDYVSNDPDEINILVNLTRKFKHCLPSNYNMHEYQDDTYNSYIKSISSKIYNTENIPSNCKLFRFHYIDVRNRKEISKITENTTSIFIYAKDIEFLELFFDVLIEEEEDFIETVKEKLSKYKEKIIEIENVLYKKDKFFEYFHIDLFNKKIKKELEKSYLNIEIYDYIKNNINLYLESKIDIFQDHIYYILELMKDRSSSTFRMKSILLEITIFYKKILIPLYAYQMDCYALSRIFKKFNEYGSLKLNQPTIPRNIIIYTGAQHSKRYSDFLSSLKFKLNDEIITDIIIDKDGNQIKPGCIDLNINNKFLDLLTTKDGQSYLE